VLVAGEIGVLAGGVYTSYTGYHDENSAGTAQLILLGRRLKEMGVVLWDLGPSLERWNKYKLNLGAEIIDEKTWVHTFDLVNQIYTG